MTGVGVSRSTFAMLANDVDGIAPPIDCAPAARFTGVWRPSPYVLLIDDDPLVQDTMREILYEYGWTVMTASTAEEVVALGDTLPAPTLLVTDINLGAGMDGFELGSLVRGRWTDTAIVYISGRPPSPERLQALGPNEIFLMKPVNMRIFDMRVSERVGALISRRLQNAPVAD
jgi:DNA-binding response OmpR family regulator